VKPEKKLYQNLKKNTPLIQHTRLETYINLGVPDCLSYNNLCGFFMIELKYTTALKMLETDKRVEFNVLINIDNAFKYVNEPLLLKDEVA